MASAILSSASIRSFGVVFRQTSAKARAAAVTARSMSPGPDSGAVAYTSPVEGSMMSE